MKGIKCKNCKNLVNDWCDVKCDSPDPTLVRDCIGFEQFTNGDRIRAMSDEELADIICCPIDGGTGLCLGIYDCLACCLKWLKQPAEVANDTD